MRFLYGWGTPNSTGGHAARYRCRKPLKLTPCGAQPTHNVPSTAGGPVRNHNPQQPERSKAKGPKKHSLQSITWPAATTKGGISSQVSAVSNER